MRREEAGGGAVGGGGGQRGGPGTWWRLATRRCRAELARLGLPDSTEGHIHPHPTSPTLHILGQPIDQSPDKHLQSLHTSVPWSWPWASAIPCLRCRTCPPRPRRCNAYKTAATQSPYMRSCTATSHPPSTSPPPPTPPAPHHAPPHWPPLHRHSTTSDVPLTSGVVAVPRSQMSIRMKRTDMSVTTRLGSSLP